MVNCRAVARNGSTQNENVAGLGNLLRFFRWYRHLSSS